MTLCVREAPAVHQWSVALAVQLSFDEEKKKCCSWVRGWAPNIWKILHAHISAFKSSNHKAKSTSRVSVVHALKVQLLLWECTWSGAHTCSPAYQLTFNYLAWQGWQFSVLTTAVLSKRGVHLHMEQWRFRKPLHAFHARAFVKLLAYSIIQALCWISTRVCHIGPHSSSALILFIMSEHPRIATLVSFDVWD